MSVILSILLFLKVRIEAAEADISLLLVPTVVLVKFQKCWVLHFLQCSKAYFLEPPRLVNAHICQTQHPHFVNQTFRFKFVVSKHKNEMTPVDIISYFLANFCLGVIF